MTTENVPEVLDLPAVRAMGRPLSSQELLSQSLTIQKILKEVMVKGVHYGEPFGGAGKPTLLQPGAEKIDATFGLAPKFHIDDLSDVSNNIYRYRLTCSLYTIRDSYFVGSAVGEASSLEEKYMWEAAICDEQWEQTDPSNRRIKWKKDKTQVKQIRTNAADLANTVLKMAAKRAHISATRGATAASDLLDVDLDEEAVQGVVTQDTAKPTIKTKAKATPAPRMPFGRSKDKQLDDPDVPLDDLKWMLDANRRDVDKPEKAKFKARTLTFITALEAEIAKREQKQAEPPKPKTGDMDDSTWADCVALMKESHQGTFSEALKEFRCFSADEVPVCDRWTFYKKVTDPAK